MHQSEKNGRCGAAAFLVLILVLALAPQVEAGRYPIRESADASGGEIRQGIRSYGSGASRLQEVPRSTAPFAGASAGTRAPGGTRISGTPMAGQVNGFAISPDGLTAVYLADQDTVGLVELYSAPVDGSAAPTKISSGLVFGTGDLGVAIFQISPAGGDVVFLADPNLGAGDNEIYSVPIDGSSAPIRLNTAAQAPVLAFGFSPTGATVAFLAPDTVVGGVGTEFYRATPGAADSGVQLSNASATVGGNVVAADFSSDGATALYAADANVDGRFQWFSVALSATGPGADVKLSNTLTTLTLGVLTPDGTTLVYVGDETTNGVLDLYSVPIGGGSATRLTGAIAGQGVSAISVGPNGTAVAYLADQLTAGVVEVFGAQIGVAGSGVRLNQPLGGGQSADVVTLGPDGLTVVYESDENVAGTFDLLSAPVDAGAGPTTLAAMTPPSNAGFFADLGTPVIAGRVVYPVLGGAGEVDVDSVPYDGTLSPVRINDPLVVGDAVSGTFLPTLGTRLIAYGVGPIGGFTDRVFAAPIRADLSPEQANLTAVGGSVGVQDYAINSSETHLVYQQDETTSGKLELYSQPLDSDQDTVANAADNCPFIANAGQGSLVFGQTVTAVNKTTFAWGNATDARYARGPLGSVATLATDQTGVLIESSGYVDAGVPGPGAGFFYLFAVDCAGRSYQTSLGSEPGRDAAGLP